MPTAETVDVRALVADIEATVARRRAAGDYPDALLERLAADFHIVRHDEPMEALAHIHMHALPVNRRPLIGRGIVFSKRLLRRSIAWYVQPIAAQQSLFNLAAVRDMRALQRRVERLETPWRRPPRAPGTATNLPLLGARVWAMSTALAGTGGPVLLLPGMSEGLCEALLAADPTLRNRLVAVATDPITALNQRTGGALSAVLAPATLGMLSPADLLSLVALASAKLAVGGALIVDAPDAEQHDPHMDASSVDPAMRRHVHRDTVTLLAEAAGLTIRNVAELHGGWYTVVAVRTSR